MIFFGLLSRSVDRYVNKKSPTFPMLSFLAFSQHVFFALS